jgi:hypothetical protein
MLTHNTRPGKLDSWARRSYTYADYLKSKSVLVYKFFDPVTEQDKYGLVEQAATQGNGKLNCLFDVAEAAEWVDKIPLRSMSGFGREDLLVRCIFKDPIHGISWLEEIGCTEDRKLSMQE